MFRKILVGMTLLLSNRLYQTVNVEFPNDSISQVKSFACDLGNNACAVYAEDAEKKIVGDVCTFQFTSNVSIIDVCAEGDESLTDYSIHDGKEIICTLSNFRDCSSVTLTFSASDDVHDKCTIYFAKDDEGYFHSSSLSLDTARRAAGQELNYNLVDESKDETTPITLSPISTCSIGETGAIYGTLKWKDAQGNTHPLAGVKVKTTMSMSWWSDETYTDASGYYRIEYSGIWHVGGGIPTIHIYTESDNVKVLSDGTYEKTYQFSSSVGGEFSYVFSPVTDGDMGKAMMILQGAKNFADYAEYLNGGTSIDFCDFKYPGATDYCYYDRNNTVNICAEAPDEGMPETYAGWDVIGHEYGHHVQHYFGIANNPGGTHYANHNAIDDQIDWGYSLSDAKDIGHRLSWGEGWATYWSTVAQSHFSSELKSIPTVGDTRYTAYNKVNYDLNYYGTGCGDADEIAIQRFLYKLYDSSVDTYDKFALGELTLWNIIVSNKPTTFYEFINDLYNLGYNKNDLGLLLSKYNVITGKMTVDDTRYFDKVPTFSWSTATGSSNLYFDSFDLYFENTNGTLIVKVEKLTASGSSVSYTPTFQIWTKIFSNSSEKFNVYFVARQTYSYTSGNYYSQVFTFNRPTKESTGRIQIKQ